MESHLVVPNTDEEYYWLLALIQNMTYLNRDVPKHIGNSLKELSE